MSGNSGVEARNRPGRRRWLLIGALLGVAALVVGLVLFKPWLLFVDVRVDEQLPTVAAPSAPVSAPSTPASGAPTPTGEAPPSSIPAVPAGPVELAAGSLISHEHPTTGTVRIVEQPDGTRVLTLENLDTTNGPDVHVWLSAADVVEGNAGWYTAGSAEYYDLGLIKGNQGNQVYTIPADVDLAKFKAVDLWCVQFGVSFGAAQLAFA
ncbi:DM13 domain-containing protein [Pseudarthrobacter sp. J75]|uniref:DM13 domain-containing protein n=1 Tax=unclassified Pseudarthrobacter TaxID=2647000 RepID=UPI002E816D07|nr:MULTISPECIES: DM13 domain-containing protein [unclassified Pseudarthrobacter]MEE2523769.1 DM13 domain-containing protein [Pseudarthrobacter sp. J47]MEE2529935.1 DM13 domain-containing protein [Pseudarthrobacter sp. J75]